MDNATFTSDQLPQIVGQLKAQVDKLTELIQEAIWKPVLPPPNDILTVQEAAEFLDLSIASIYSQVHKGIIPVYKRGNRLYFNRNELIQAIEEGKKLTRAEIAEKADTYIKEKGRKNGR